MIDVFYVSSLIALTLWKTKVFGFRGKYGCKFAQGRKGKPYIQAQVEGSVPF